MTFELYPFQQEDVDKITRQKNGLITPLIGAILSRYNIGMDNITEIEKAYTAGFFDGDGTINCNISSGGTFRINMGITQKDRECLDWIMERFGGHIVPERDRYWRWTPSNKEEFLRIIVPYLVLKKLRVERLLTEYYDVAALRYGSRGMPLEEIERRENLVIWFKSITLATTGKPSTIGGGANAISTL